MQRQNLRDVNPWNTIDGSTKDEHILHMMLDKQCLLKFHRVVLTVKKKATLADAVGFSTAEFLKLSKIEIIIIEIPRPKEPHIMGRRRPIRSTNRDGTIDPSKNMIWILLKPFSCCMPSIAIQETYTPPRSKLRFRSRPTLFSSTVGIKYLSYQFRF